MIRSKKCSVMLNKAPISEYHVAKRVGPTTNFNWQYSENFLKIILWHQKKDNNFGHDHD